MKSLLLSIVLVLGFSLIPHQSKESVHTGKLAHDMELSKVDLKPVKPLPPSPIVITDSILVHAMIYVESRGNDSIIGDGGNAVGCLQIWPIMVRQVNYDAKVLGLDCKFTDNDRYNRNKSIQMFKIWKKRHHSKSTAEKVARNWNGGPNGYKKQSTKYYWNKILKQLDNNS